jgi:hypothetical protein
MDAEVSTNMPMRKSSRFTASRKLKPLSNVATIHSLIIAGIPILLWCQDRTS